MFEWHEEKRDASLRKHGLDFADAVEIFAGPHLILEARSDIEIRKRAIGIVHDNTIAIIYTMRGEVCRIITVRKARRDEREAYDAYVARRDTETEKPN